MDTNADNFIEACAWLSAVLSAVILLSRPQLARLDRKLHDIEVQLLLLMYCGAGIVVAGRVLGWW